MFATIHLGPLQSGDTLSLSNALECSSLLIFVYNDLSTYQVVHLKYILQAFPAIQYVPLLVHQQGKEYHQIHMINFTSFHFNYLHPLEVIRIS